MTVLLAAACSPPPPSGVTGPACSEDGGASLNLGGVAEAGVSDDGFHNDVDLSMGALVRPGRMRCAASEPRSQF